MNTMREYFFRRFGAGQPEKVKERERVYLLGMPGPTGEAFPSRCNMKEKLDSLETKRDFLLDMCPKDKHDTYDAGKETTLVRILQQTLPKEYDGGPENGNGQGANSQDDRNGLSRCNHQFGRQR
jgi:hypothetical protein